MGFLVRPCCLRLGRPRREIALPFAPDMTDNKLLSGLAVITWCKAAHSQPLCNLSLT